ncbi:VWA domain-containing protein [Isosphaeraceae bacterium EP7]
MPALYRMPVVYLVTLLAVLAWGLPGLLARRVATRPAASTPAVSAEKTDASSKPKPFAVAIPPADGILRTADGLRRKVVIKDLDVVCSSDPVAGYKAGRPLDYFSIHFVYGEASANGRPVIQIGPREGPPRGWVPADSVFEWDTRVMARPTPRSGRAPLVIYREEPCLLDALAGRDCPRHAPNPCPTEGEEDAASQAAATLGIPVLATKVVPQQEGPPRTIYQVASLVSDRAPPQPRPREVPADFLPALKRTYVAFAVDTTASMQATIDAARRLASGLADETQGHARDVTLRLGLVEYRDAAPAFGFRARVVTEFTDPQGFLKALEQIEAASRGDGSVDEAVMDGLAVALPAAPGETVGTLRHLDWPTGRAGELATKMLVLLGDAPDHERGTDRADALAALAKTAGITIAAVGLDRPGQLSRDEKNRREAQWNALAAGSFLPGDKANGFARPIEPVVIDLTDSGRLESTLQALIADRVEHARTLAALAAAEAEGKLAEYVNARGLTLDKVAPVLVDLHRGEPDAVPRPDPRQGGRKAPSVRRGWVAQTMGEARLVTLDVLMSRDELDDLIRELVAWQKAAASAPADLVDLARIGAAAAAGETSFLAADRGDQTFADAIQMRGGLPPARPDGLLGRTQSELLRADDAYLGALDRRLRSSIAALLRRRNDADWSDPARTVDGLAPVAFDLIDF